MKPRDEAARLCKGVLRIQAAFREVMDAVSAANCPSSATAHSPNKKAAHAGRGPMPEDPLARRNWEIAAALDFAFSEMEEPSPASAATPEEIAATIEKALPEDVSFGSSRGGSPQDAEVFAIPYDFELKCLLNISQWQASTQWIPTSILRSFNERNEKN